MRGLYRKLLTWVDRKKSKFNKVKGFRTGGMQKGPYQFTSAKAREEWGGQPMTGVKAARKVGLFGT